MTATVSFDLASPEELRRRGLPPPGRSAPGTLSDEESGRTAAGGEVVPLVVPTERTYGLLSLDPPDARPGDRRWLKLDKLEPHTVIRFKQLFPKIEKTKAQPFYLPTDPASCADVAWFTSRYPMRVWADAQAVIDQGCATWDRWQREAEALQLPTWTPPAYVGLKPGKSVRRYQAQAIEMLKLSGGLLLGDDLGLGKTVSAIGAMLVDGMLPAAVVMPANLQAQWRDKIAEFTTLRVHMIKGTRPYDLPEADVYLWRYSQIAGWCDTFEALACRLAVFDEIQELRTGQGTAKGHAARRLVDAASFRLGLSATPIYNYGDEIYEVMRFLKPGVLGGWEEFIREWLKYDRVVADPKALGSYLRDQRVFLRRTKPEVGQELPKVDRIVQTVECDGKAMAAIEERARALALRAMAGVHTERGRAALELDLMVRQQTGVAKARAVAQVVRILVEGGAPVVLVGWHRDVYDIWLEELADLEPAMYTGSETAGQKGRSVESFLAGETDILILSLRSGAGLDGLQARCSTIVFGELDWSPGVHGQCIGRLDREGQTQPVTALFLVCDEGSDPPIMDVLALKASQAAGVVDPFGTSVAPGADDSNLRLLVERYLDQKARAVIAETEAAEAQAKADAKAAKEAAKAARAADRKARRRRTKEPA